MDSLTHIVYCICNDLEYENPNFTESEQYNAQLTQLLREEEIVKKIVYKTALDFVKEDEHKEYLGYIFRSLSISASLLEGTLDAENAAKNDPTVLLQEQAFAVIERLTTFFSKCFPNALVIDSDHDTKLKLGISVPQIGALANAIVNATDITNNKDDRVLIQFIIRHFCSKYTTEISEKSLLNQFRDPEPAAIKRSITLLEEMIRYLKML